MSVWSLCIVKLPVTVWSAHQVGKVSRSPNQDPLLCTPTVLLMHSWEKQTNENRGLFSRENELFGFDRIFYFVLSNIAIRPV